MDSQEVIETASGPPRFPRLWELAHEKLDIRFFHLVWIFVIASVVGLFVETAVSFPIDGVWKSRSGYVWGPLSPIYGVGALLMTVLLERLRGKNVVVMFVVACIAGGAFEFAAGTFFESAFGFVAWTYEGQLLSIGDKTCLAISLVWGTAGTLWATFALPVIYHLIDKIPQKARVPLTAVVFTFVIVDSVATLAAFDCWYLRASGVPVTTPVQQACAVLFPDSFMDDRFQTISMYTQLAAR